MKHGNRFGEVRTQRPRIRVRILRGHPFYLAGTVLEPPAGARDILLRQRDQLGRPVAEIVTEEEKREQPWSEDMTKAELGEVGRQVYGLELDTQHLTKAEVLAEIFSLAW